MNSSAATEPELPEPRDILYINVSRIGDTLLVTPAVRAVAARWPQARIHLLAHPKREEVLRHLPFVHRTGTIEKQRARFMGWLPGKPYDLAFVCNFDAPLVEYALRVARRVVAFRQPDAALNARLYKAVEHPALQTTHAVDIQLMLPAAVGATPAGKALSYRVTTDEAQWAASFLAEHQASERHPLIGLQVASFPTKAYRDWPPGHFSELCRRIHAAWPQAHFLIFGGAQEKDRTEALAAELGSAATLCAGKLSLRETAALMKRVDLYVGVDTGPTHLMGALQRPLVALYHGYSPSRVLAPLDHPCLYEVDHPRADRCTPEASMADITVDRVFDRVREALSSPQLSSQQQVPDMENDKIQSTTDGEVRFTFGANWMDYAKLVTDQHIDDAVRRMNALIDTAELHGASFIDVGCGSGLHSLAALKQGVGKLVALDYDPLSVETTRSILAKLWHLENYEVRRDDILSLAAPIEPADIVYSWGVLHHTGDMRRALLNTAGLVRPGGLLVVALYGKTRYCGMWTKIKRWYCQADETAKRKAEYWYIRLFGWYLRLRGEKLSTHIASYSKKRGMDFLHDVRDWLGGYPYESIAPDEIKELLDPLGFKCIKQNVHRRSGLFGSGCDEYIFRAP